MVNVTKVSFIVVLVLFNIYFFVYIHVFIYTLFHFYNKLYLMCVNSYMLKVPLGS